MRLQVGSVQYSEEELLELLCFAQIGTQLERVSADEEESQGSKKNKKLAPLQEVKPLSAGRQTHVPLPNM